MTTNEFQGYLSKEFVRWGLAQEIIDDLHRMKMQLGKPSSEIVNDFRNADEPELTNQIHVLTYDGLEIHVMHVNYPEPYDIIFKLRVTNNNHPMKFDVRIGDTRDKIERLLGKGEVDGGSMKYSVAEPICCDTVRFYFGNDNRVNIVQWDKQLD